MTVMEQLIKYKWAIAGGLVVLVVFITFLQNNSVTNNGNKKQQGLITLYNDTTNVLSDCLVKTKQSIGATRAQTDALDEVITGAVQGRYQQGSTAQPGSQNALFSAIQEAYPETSGLSRTFDKVLTIINGCRGDFRDSQSILQRGVDRFESWRTGSLTTRTFAGEYPTKDLRIKVKGAFVTGQTAIDQMRTLVVVADAQSGRDTGKIENDNPFDKRTTTTP